MDLISDLPDEILGKILSFLPIKLVLSTCIVSKRWKTLLPFVPNFDFPYFALFLKRRPHFSVFMHENPYTWTDTYFFLNCANFPDAQAWIRSALAHQCLELHLSRHDFLDLNVFSTNNLLKLTLSDGVYLTVGERRLDDQAVLFPMLKSLTLGEVHFTNATHDLLFHRNLPVLEELFIRDHVHPVAWNGRVSSKSIKRLEISLNNLPTEDFHCGIQFDAPSLASLVCSCYVLYWCRVENLDSLVEARLDIWVWESASIDDDDSLNVLADYHHGITDLVVGLSNVKTLHLSPSSLEVFHWCCKSMPVFNNLLHLSIESRKKRGWQVVPLLLKRSPNLQTLVIKGLLHKVTSKCGDVCACAPNKFKKRKMMKGDEVSCLSTCRVKTLEILQYGGSNEELEQIRHFLRNLKCLETLKIGLQQQDNNNTKNYWRAKLMTLTRLSLKCNIQFI